MAYSITFELDEPRMVSPYQMHGLVSTWLESTESASVHLGSSKAFTVGPAVIGSDGLLRCTVTLLRDDWESRLVGGIQDGRWRVGLGRARGAVLEGEAGFRQTSRAPWESLADAPPCTELTLRFLTPTLFRRRKLDVPVPDPRTMLDRLADRWHDYGPGDIGHRIDFGDSAVVPVGFELRTETAPGRDHRHLGFVGWMRIRLETSEAANRAALARLGALSEFSGIGSNTTYGFGVVRCEPG